MAKSLLLASFVTKSELYGAIEHISKIINSTAIFSFINELDDNEYILTYNLGSDLANIKFETIWRNTISVHRKKQTNTIYSLNAMNELIKSRCNGYLDKTYQIDWSAYDNSLLIIKGGKLKVIPLKLVKLNQ